MGLANRDDVDRILSQWRRERPDLDPSGMGVVLRVLGLAGALSRRLDHLLTPTALAPFEFDVLSALRRGDTGEGMTSKVLCAAAQLTSGAMTHRLDRLEDRGLILRKPSSQDRRALAVSLTTRGRRLVDGVLARRMDDAKRCVAGLSKKDRQSLARLLRALGQDLAELPLP